MSSPRFLRFSLSLVLSLTVSSGSSQQASPASSPSAAPAAQSAPAATLAQASSQQQQPAASSTPGNGEGGSATPTIRTTSRIVILDTVVLDKKGNVVTGLKREDFHVEEEGTPQTLIAFEPTNAHTPPPDAEINSTQDLDRIAPRAPVNIILLDEFNTRFEDMAFARYSLKKYLQKQPDRLTMPTMLIAVSLQNFTVVHDYTQDKQAILTALDKHLVTYPWQVHQGGWLAERYSTAFGTLLRIAEATEGHQGHKNMIWIGRGFPSLNFANVAIDTQNRVQNVVQECVNKLRDARVTLYTIDPAGVQTDPYAYGQAAGDFDPFGGNYEFNKLATATGGRTFYGRNDVDAEIGTSLRDGASFYTLVYRPTGAADNPRKFRRIRITFDNPDYKAVTRTGYYPRYGPYRVDPTKPNRRLAFDLFAANSSTMVYDGVPLTLQQDPANPDNFTVHVDAKGLNWTVATDTEPRRCEVIIMATSFDKKGKELQRVAKNIKVSAPATVNPTGRLERSMDLKLTIPHDAHAVRARFVVRVASTGRIGTADSPMNQPPQHAAAPVVSATPAP